MTQLEAASTRLMALCSAQLQRVVAGLVALLALALIAGASDKPEKTHPQHGKILSMRTELQTEGRGVYTDSEGGVHGGRVRTTRVPVYLLHTEAMDYEIEGKKLSVGDEVSFRAEKDKVYIQDGAKEHKYHVVGQHLVNQGK